MRSNELGDFLGYFRDSQYLQQQFNELLRRRVIFPLLRGIAKYPR